MPELDTDLRIARVIDQRAEFLRLLERHRLVPGNERRSSFCGTKWRRRFEVRPEGDEPLQLGYHAGVFESWWKPV